MNDKELGHIKSHQYNLVNTLCYNRHLTSFLVQQKHIGDADIQAMDVEYKNGGNAAAVCKLLDILKTRPGSYSSLLEGARELNQHGVVHILEKLTIADSRITPNCNNSSRPRSRESTICGDGTCPIQIHGAFPGNSTTFGSIVIGTKTCPIDWLVSIIKDFPGFDVLFPQQLHFLAIDLGVDETRLKYTKRDYASRTISHLEVLNDIIVEWANRQKSNALLLQFIGILEHNCLPEWADRLRKQFHSFCEEVGSSTTPNHSLVRATSHAGGDKGHEVLTTETGIVCSLKRLDIGQNLPKMKTNGHIIVGGKECPVSKVTSILTSSDFLSRFDELWGQFARNLKIPEHKILQLRNDPLLTLQLSDVVCEIISAWAAGSGKEATLQELIRILKEIGIRNCAEALEESFPCLSSSSSSNDQLKQQLVPEEGHTQLASSSSTTNSAASVVKNMDATHDKITSVSSCLRSQRGMNPPFPHLFVQNYKPKKETLNLLKSCVNFNSKDHHGDTVLAYAIKANWSTQFISDLITEYGANPEHKNNRSENFLHISALHGSVDALTLFLSREELDVNIGNADGNTPLHVAVIRVDEDVVLQLCDLLIKNGAKVTATNIRSQTVLHAATDCSLISLKVMKFLIQHLGEGDPTAKDDEGQTFLYVLVVKKYQQCDEILEYICDRFDEKVLQILMS